MRGEDIDEAAAEAARQQAERELSDQNSEFDFSRVQANLHDQAAMLRTVRKMREVR